MIQHLAWRGLGKTAKVHIDRGVLERLYLNEKKSTLEIGRLLDCSKKTVRLRLLEFGIPIRNAKEAFAVSTTHGRVVVGEKHQWWRGGTRHKCGYKMLKRREHPRADADGYVMEHWLIAEALIGRPLKADEEVHHINEIRTDNRPDNLAVMTKSEHMSMHMTARHKAGKIPYRRQA